MLNNIPSNLKLKQSKEYYNTPKQLTKRIEEWNCGPKQRNEALLQEN